ncbi:hypothetical protein GCM10017744_017050 [Streptomyces antimycoticus]|uniref:MmpS family membrane protein n=1 Tax=Streptomyces antimycoticus TaxID=68175 RepID=A0A4D4KLI9_9ACTN|nr:hypothetical protein [Streptomyces antimycoticus]GDY47570.1 hypothetical protein SANT12839_084520 [Streptomyces antimycoticus]
MSWNNQPSPAPSRPRWARKRVALPVAAILLFAGVGIGSAQGEDAKAADGDKPTPKVTVTVTAKPARVKDTPEPAPTVTVTKTVTAKPKPKPKKSEEAPAGTAVFKVWGSAPSGVDITYGSDGENLDGSGLPLTRKLKVKDDALYYQISAQLMGGGDIRCSVTIDGETKTGHARGGYNICSAQLNGDFTGGWD